MSDRTAKFAKNLTVQKWPMIQRWFASFFIRSYYRICEIIRQINSDRNFKHVDVTVRKMDVRYHGSLIRRHLNLRFSRAWIYVDGDRVEISLWFYNTRVKIGRGNLKVPRKPLIGPAHANAGRSPLCGRMLDY